MELSPKKPINDIVTVICAKCKAEILCNMTTLRNYAEKV